MTNSKATKKALFMSMLSLLLCFTMLMGATFAWFTDTVKSTNNIIKSGNLDIELYYQIEGQTDWTKVDANSNIFKENALWEPGYTEIVRLKAVNEGSLALKYQLGVNVASETGSVNVNGENFKLSDHIKFGLVDGAANYTRDTAIAAVTNPTPLATAYTSDVIELYPAGYNGDTENTTFPKEQIVTLVVYMPTSVDNVANHAKDAAIPTINLGLNVNATQLAAEVDSFDKTYDENADFDGQISTYSALTAAIEKGGNFEVKADITIPEGETITIPEGTTLSLNLGGNTITSANHKSVGAVIENNGTLTITGGTISSTGANGGSAIANNGTLTVNGSTLNGAPNADGSWPSYTVNNTGTMTINNAKVTSVHGAVASYGTGAELTLNNTDIAMSGIPGFTSHGIYTYNSGKVIVNGGNIANNAADQTSTGASVINGAVTVNAGTFSGRIENYYGTPVIKGGTFSVKPNETFLAPNTLVNENVDGTYTVINVAEGEVAVKNSAELTNAITNASATETNTFVLGSGTYSNDIKLTLAAQGTQKGDIVFKAAEGANVVFTGTTTLGYREQGVGAAMWDGNVTFEGVTFDHAGSEKHSIDVEDVKSLTLKNCTIIGDGEFGITSARGNGTGSSTIIGCTFKNAGMQLLGNFATGLIIDDCDFIESCINVQAGNGVTVQNCRFDSTLTDANVGESFYLVRSNSTPITVKNCTVKVDSTVSSVAASQAKWGIFWNRGTTNWTVSDVAVTLTDAATAQTELLVTKTASTGKINTTNLTVNGVAYNG